MKMAISAFARVFVLVLLCVHVLAQKYRIPEVTIQPLIPKGVRISIPGDSNITLFVFQGNINKAINENDVGAIKAEVTSPTDGLWLYEDKDIQLKTGDIIYYYVFVTHNRSGYLKDKQTYVVKDLEDSSTKDSTDACKPTATVVKDGTACGGQVIFEDKFDTLREDTWQVEQYIPDEPDYPFVSYQRPPAAAVKVTDGNLRIEPKLQQSLPGFHSDLITSGTLDLFSGCTATSTKCRAEAWGASILPPIASGRLTSKKFAFKYGVVEIRAKLPKGDWLYPDILLEPVMKRYGEVNYASGVMRVAGALGNEVLYTDGQDRNDQSNKILYGGLIMASNCRKNLIRYVTSKEAWGDKFSVFEVRWTPDNIVFSVDGNEYARFEPNATGLIGHFDSTCELPRRSLISGSSIAPFDDYFSITLGLAAGGITEFDDYVISGSSPKPWKNSSRKASLNFWQDLVNWLPTWKQPMLMVDYVKVRAL